MKQLLSILSLCLIASFLNIGMLHAQQFQWVKGGGTVADMTSYGSFHAEQVKFMCTDINGNVYAISQVGDDPITADTFSATPYGATDNILLTSYNCNGQ